MRFFFGGGDRVHQLKISPLSPPAELDEGMDEPVDYSPKSSSVFLDDVDDDVEPQIEPYSPLSPAPSLPLAEPEEEDDNNRLF